MDSAGISGPEVSPLQDQFLSAVDSTVKAIRPVLKQEMISEVVNGELVIGLPKSVAYYFTDETLKPLTDFIDSNFYGNEYHFFLGTMWSLITEIVTNRLLPLLAEEFEAAKLVTPKSPTDETKVDPIEN